MSQVILRPNAAGDATVWTPYPSAPNYGCVNEESADDDSSYVERNDFMGFDHYDIETSALLVGATINWVRVYGRAKKIDTGGSPPANTLYLQIHPSGGSANSVGHSLTDSYDDYYGQWDENPADDEAWEKADIDDLGIGVYGGLVTQGVNESYPRCTQLYLLVDYTEAVSGNPWNYYAQN